MAGLSDTKRSAEQLYVVRPAETWAGIYSISEDDALAIGLSRNPSPRRLIRGFVYCLNVGKAYLFGQCVRH